MNINYLWLKEQLDACGTPDEVATLLTVAGLEVEGVAPVAPDFTQVVVGHVTAIEQHPDADRLRVCTVDVGAEAPLNIVCGAKNVADQMKVPVATVGARLPGDFKIKKSKLRGVLSEGMICSETELGLADSSDGIMPLPADAPVGQDFREYWQLDDTVFDISLTPNRGDCLSVRGVARELAVLSGTTVLVQPTPTIEVSSTAQRDVKIEDQAACPIYCGRVIENISPGLQSPMWLAERLRRCGIAPISLVVDVTQYVMLLLGQPMHAFDDEKLSGTIRVRPSTENEQIALLDGSEKQCQDQLMIADDQHAVALAGIMGGLDSSVTDTTTRVFLEAAHFTPLAIAGKARGLGMHTEASHRFERGVDPSLPEQAIALATDLIISIAGGNAGPVTVTSHYKAEKSVIEFPAALCERMLGLSMSAQDIAALLRGLEMSVEVQGDTLKVVPPSFRFDIALPQDCIEEVARVKGFDAIEEVMPSGMAKVLAGVSAYTSKQRFKSLLAARDYHEAIHYSFISEDMYADFFPDSTPYGLSNPLSQELSVMRAGLLPGLLSSCMHNHKRQHPRVRLFELGTVFEVNDGKVQERTSLAGIASGPLYDAHWQANPVVDFYHVKADLEALFSALGLSTIVFEPCTEHPVLHPGQSATIVINGKRAGVVGALHPLLKKKYKLKTNTPVVFECDVECLFSSQISPQFIPLSKFPSVKRDLALVIDNSVTMQDLMSDISEYLGSILKDVQVFDLYRDERLGETKKSVALSLILQDSSRTLRDSEINSAMSGLLEHLSEARGAALRE